MGEMFADDATDTAMAEDGIGPLPSALRGALGCHGRCGQLTEATLTVARRRASPSPAGAPARATPNTSVTC